MDEKIIEIQFQISLLMWRVNELEKEIKRINGGMVKVEHDPTFDDVTHHCGQDASLKSLLGMEVVAVTRGKCEGCPNDHYGVKCVKVELVGGSYICLAPAPNTIVK